MRPVFLISAIASGLLVGAALAQLAPGTPAALPIAATVAR